MPTLTGNETLEVLGQSGNGLPSGSPFICTTQDIADLGGGGGGGDISGTLGSTDNAVPRANGTGGHTIQGSVVTIADTTGVIAGTQGVTFTGSSSGTTALVPTAAASGTITMPAASGIMTVLGNTATGTGIVVLATSPTLVTPALGVATATSINGATVTATTGGTLTLASSSTLATSGAHSITLTSTADTNVTLPTSGTVLSSATPVTIAQGGTNITTYASGDILYSSASNVLSKLAKGSDGQFLKLVSGLPAWAAGGGGSSPLTTKGDLYTYASADARLGVGTDGQILSADSAQTTGLKWVTAAGGGNVTGPVSSTSTAIARYSGTGGTTLLDSGVLIDGSNNISGVGTLAAGATTITSGSANSLTVGPNGATTPILQVDSSTATAVVGLKITGGASGGGVSVAAVGGGTNEALTIASKAAGSLTLNAPSSTASVVFQVNTSARYTVGNTSHSFVVGASGTASTIRWKYAGAANTSLTAGTEFTQTSFDMSQTNQHASNTGITTQRDMRILGMSHSFASATGTITDAYALYIDPPAAGTNAVITNAWALGLNGNIQSIGKHVFDSTITAGGTTGNQTINKPSGTVNIAATGTAITVTNSFCTISSIVYATVRTNDTTALIKSVVPGSGSFVITMNAAVTAETSIGFIVFN